MKISVKNLSGEKVRDLTLNDAVWNIEANTQVLKKMIKLQLDSMRQGTHKTKTRSADHRIARSYRDLQGG